MRDKDLAVDSLAERQRRAREFQCAHSLQFPVVVDEPGDAVAGPYGAWPQRVVIVDTGGWIVYATPAGPGQMDFAALQACLDGLAASIGIDMSGTP